jgi:DNA-binding CsgD family transcriptional regulator
MVTEAPAPTPDRRSGGQHGPRLFERGQFLDELDALFSQSLAVPSRCIAVEGPWGSGRTALLNAAADLAGLAGCLVLRTAGGGWEQQTPFAGLARLVGSAGAQSAAPESVRVEALRLETTLTGDRRDATRAATGFHRLVLTLRRLAPVLLVVDDADQADPETLAVLQYLVRRLEHQQIWLVLGTRPLHPGVGLRPVDALLAGPDVRQFVLEPLHDDSVSDLLAGFFDDQPDRHFVTACREATGGSPFLLKALLPALRRSGMAPTAATAGHVAQVRAPKVTQSVLSRLAQLPVTASELLQAGAVLDDGADRGVVREVAEIDGPASLRAAGAAEQIGLLRPGAPLTFTSPLVRWAVYHDIPPARRSALHARAAQVLRERGAEDALVARHLLATEPVGDRDAAHRLQEIGRGALRSGQEDLALACFDRALAEGPPAEERVGLLLDLAGTERGRDPSSALAHLRQALELTGTETARAVRVGVDLLDRVAGLPGLRAEVAGLLQASRSRFEGMAHPLRVELEVALTLTAARPLDRAHGMTRLRSMVTETGSGSGQPGDCLARTLLEVERVLSSASVPADLSSVVLERAVRSDLLDDAGPMANRVRSLALFGLLCTDRFPSVDRHLVTAPDGATDDRQAVLARRLADLSALSMLWRGSLTQAEEAYRHGQETDPVRPGEPSSPAIGAIDALVEQGRMADAQHLADSTDPEWLDDPLLRSVALTERSRLLMAQERRREGVDQLVAVGAELVQAGVHNPALVPWRADAAMALSALGEWEEAGRLAEENLRLAQGIGAPRTTGNALRAMAAASPDPVHRTRWLGEALLVLEPSPARLETAHALVELGAVLVERGEKEEARGTLRRGATLASQCGAHRLVEVAGELLRAAGGRPRRLGAVGLESLTPAERRVVGLAAGGMTNQGIADTLYVTLKTVEGHLAKSYRKLGIESRRELGGALAPDVRSGGDGEGDGDGDGDGGDTERGDRDDRATLSSAPG